MWERVVGVGDVLQVANVPATAWELRNDDKPGRICRMG